MGQVEWQSILILCPLVPHYKYSQKSHKPHSQPSQHQKQQHEDPHLPHRDVNGGLSGVSRCADTGARTPIGVSGNFGPSEVCATSGAT